MYTSLYIQIALLYKIYKFNYQLFFKKLYIHSLNNK